VTPDSSRLLQPHLYHRRVQIELTTDCNLRCIYCALSDPGYQAAHMADDVFHKITELCRQGEVEVINVSGHGESTGIPDWQEKITALLDAGFKLQISTNAANPWSWDDADLMSRFVHVMVSVDTADPDLLRQLRRKVDLRTISHNITLIRAAAARAGRPAPRLGLTGVLSDRSVVGLDRLVALASALGCEVNLSNLIELHGISENPPRSLFSLSGEALAQAHMEYVRATETAARLKVPLNIHPNLRSYLDAAPSHGFQGKATLSAWERNFKGCTLSQYVTASDALQPGETRNCLDPWSMLYFAVDGTIHPCCLSHLDPLCHVGDVDSLEQIYSMPRSRAYRQGLIEGRPPTPCIACIGRSRVPIQDYAHIVEQSFPTKP